MITTDCDTRIPSYSGRTFLQDAIKDGVSRSQFYKKLLYWELGNNKYIEARRRYLKIFLDARLHRMTYKAIASSEGTCGVSRIKDILQLFEYRIRRFILEANKEAPEDLENISLDAFLHQINLFYELFVK